MPIYRPIYIYIKKKSRNAQQNKQISLTLVIGSYPLNPFHSQLTRNNSKTGHGSHELSHAYRLQRIDGDVLLIDIQAMYLS